jgi:hypothetical protein
MRATYFIERYRFLLFFTTIVALVLLGFYSAIAGMKTDYSFQSDLVDCLSGTRSCPQNTIVLLAQVKSNGSESITVNIKTKRGSRWEDLFDRDHSVLVIGRPPQTKVGQVLALRGVLLSNDRFLLEAYQMESKWTREIKYLISLFALVLTAILWARSCRFCGKRFLFFLKDTDNA